MPGNENAAFLGEHPLLVFVPVNVRLTSTKMAGPSSTITYIAASLKVVLQLYLSLQAAPIYSAKRLFPLLRSRQRSASSMNSSWGPRHQRSTDSLIESFQLFLAKLLSREASTGHLRKFRFRTLVRQPRAASLARDDSIEVA